jgi:cysteine desulfurase
MNYSDKIMTAHYFDYASSTPPFPEALAEFTRISTDHFGNPSSAHYTGREANKTLTDFKNKFKEICYCEKARLILTSGGTEANNLVIKGVMEKYPQGRLLLAADVHESSWFAKEFYRNRVDVVPLEKNGRLSLKKIQHAINRKTIIFSAVHVCNETGAIHDIAAYGELCQNNKIFFHCDGSQALGHIEVNSDKVSVDFYTFSAHKFGGPRGTGGLFANSTELAPQIMGGGQEQELRAGTENVAGLAAAVKALEISNSMIPAERSRLKYLSDLLLDILNKQGVEFIINSDENGLPGLLSISFPGSMATNLITEMSLRGFALSAGSACHSNDIEPSRIIIALGRSKKQALGTVRISMGRNSNEEEVRELAKVLGQVVERHKILA